MVVTLCVYAQQDYVWSCRFVYVCVYVYVDKIMGCLGYITTGKSPVSVIYCSLIEFNGQKRGLLCQVIRSGEKIWNHSINGMEKESWKIV